MARTRTTQATRAGLLDALRQGLAHERTELARRDEQVFRDMAPVMALCFAAGWISTRDPEAAALLREIANLSSRDPQQAADKPAN